MSLLLFVFFAVNSFLIATSCSDYSIELCDSVGCEWVNTTRTTCGPSASECSRKTTGVTCEAVVGCWWSGATVGKCGPPDESTCLRSSSCGAGCKQNAANGYCQSPPYWSCDKWTSQTSCETAIGCEWWDGSEEYCHGQESQRVNCKFLEKAVCQATANCSYSSRSGNCSLQTRNLCSGFTTESSCQTSERGCTWFTDRCAFSSSHYCAANDDNTACSSDSSQYCIWNSGTDFCSSDFVGSCSYGDKTECDRIYGCEWESIPSHCIQDYDFMAGCGGTCLAPCEWIDAPCGVNDSLYCVNNRFNDGCNSVISDPGCVWHEATTGSCGLGKRNLYPCIANEANTGCSLLSVADRCMEKSELVGSCQDIVRPPEPSGSASFIIIPWLTLLLAFVISF